MKPVSILTLRRLSQYLQIILEAQKNKQEYISATVLSNLTGVHRTQVRKDLASTGVVGVPKLGHKVNVLAQAIGEFLNWNDTTEAFLVGAGNLGSALVGYRDIFETKGMKILAAFDTNPALIGTKIHDVPVFAMEKFSNLAQRLHVHIGILTVPPESAQRVADMMVQAGILAIWNFAPLQLAVPEYIIVENVDLYASLAVLSQRLAVKLMKQSE